LALTPQNNDAFFREVDDELRRSRLDGFGRRWGVWIAAGVIVALIAFAGWLWYAHEKTKQAGLAGEKLDQAVTALAENRGAQAKPVLAELAKDGNPGYRAAAKLALADLALQDGKDAQAVAGFRSVADDTSLDQPYRDLALVREISAGFDAMPPAQVIARLKPLVVPGSPWFGSAGEMTAAAHLKMNRRDLATPIFVAVAKDERVPMTLRTRAAQMVTASGVDVAIPGMDRTSGEQQ
jgi:hypothetical protein